MSLEVPPEFKRILCTSKAHEDYSCMLRWSTSGFKFTAEKWCNACIEYYKFYLERDGEKFYASNTGGKGKTPKKPRVSHDES